MNWEGKGIKIDGEFLNNLRFADDVVIITDNEKDLKEMITELNEESKKAGLEMNIKKSNVMTNSEEKTEIMIDNQKLEYVEEIIYLGQKITIKNRTKKEIDRRITIAWNKFWSLKHILKGQFKIQHKIEILNKCVLPALIYGAQTWSMTKKDEQKIRITQNRMERSILNIKLKDRINIQKIKMKLGQAQDFVAAAKRLKWDWVGHVSRQGQKQDRWTGKIVNWYIKEGRKRGKQRKRWDDEIVDFLSNRLYHRVAWDRCEWARLREAFAQN